MRRPTFALAAAMTFAAPVLVLAQQQSPLGQTLENLGRSLQGQGDTGRSGVDRSDRQSRDDAMDRAYRENSREFARYSDDELRRVDRQLSQAWAELQGASRALDDEMARRSGSGSSRRDDRRSGSSDDYQRR